MTKNKYRAQTFASALLQLPNQEFSVFTLHLSYFWQIILPSSKLESNPNNSFTLKMEKTCCSKISEYLITGWCKKPKDCNCLNSSNCVNLKAYKMKIIFLLFFVYYAAGSSTEQGVSEFSTNLQELHPVGSLCSKPDPTYEPWSPCRYLHFLSYHSHQDCTEMVRSLFTLSDVWGHLK